MVLLITAILLPQVLCPHPSAAEEKPQGTTRDLIHQITDLRATGDYHGALEIMHVLAERYENDRQTARNWSLDLDRSVETLDFLSNLPEADKAEMTLADSLHKEVRSAWGAGRFTDGAEMAQRRLEIQRRYLGERHPEIATTLFDLARHIGSLADNVRAEALFREILEMRTELLGRDHVDIAVTLQMLSGYTTGRGDFVLAERQLSEALQIYKTIGLVGRKKYDECLMRYAVLHLEQGDLVKAELLFRRALASNRKRWGSEHWMTATALNNLAVIHVKHGDYASAEPLLREALEIRRRVLEEGHPHIVQSVNALAVAVTMRGDLEAAEPLLREALAQYRELLGDHPGTVTILGNLGSILTMRERFAEAESVHTEAIRILQERPSAYHAGVAQSYCYLARNCLAHGEPEIAEAHFRRALSLEREFYGSYHPTIGATLRGLSGCLLAQDRYAEAEPLLAEAAEIFETARLRAATGFARATFQRSPYAELATTRLELGKHEAAWPAAERALGRALADLLASSRSRSLSRTELSQEADLKKNLTAVEDKLAALMTASRSDSSKTGRRELETTRTQLAAAEWEWKHFQRELASRYPVTEGQSLPLDRIQIVLDGETALVGWIQMRASGGMKQPTPWGYVIRDSGPVRWVRLESSDEDRDRRSPAAGAEDFQQSLAEAASWPIRVTDVDRIHGEARRLCSQWFAPLSPHLDGVRNLVAIPHGPMRGLPIEALIDSRNRLLGERYTISYAPSASLYAWLQELPAGREAHANRRGLILGDPPYNEEHLAAMEDDPEPAASVAPVQYAAAGHSLDPNVVRGSLAGDGEALDRLPRLLRARDEVEKLASVLPGSTILTGADASEQELVRLAESGALHGYDTIHLATHALVDNELPARSALVLSLVDLPDPLDAVTQGNRVFDGLLTVKEILRDWELDADLVTLSGCQTALGRKAAGEGYVGLASAFLLVGARSLVVSLWKVEDRATSLLMGRFYENLTGSFDDERNGRQGVPMSKAEALREAKHWLRTYSDEEDRQPFRHPTYWSGFVLIGEP